MSNHISVTTKKTAARSHRAKKMAGLGLISDRDLILHLPLRYEDETKIVTISEAIKAIGQVQQVQGVVTDCNMQLKPRRQLVVTIVEGAAQLTLRFINIHGGLTAQLAVGHAVRARGEIRQGFGGGEIIHPQLRAAGVNADLPNTLTPIYPSTEGLPQTYLRKAILSALTRRTWPDTLAQDILRRLNLTSFADAIEYLHLPPRHANQESLESRTHPAWVRLKFDELLAQQLSLKRARLARQTQSAQCLSAGGALAQAFLTTLPFKLTEAQNKVLREIRFDLQSSYPMQRLLQGDVGSGKTVVAAFAAIQALDAGYQAAVMVPTEILAEQHFHKMCAWLSPLGVSIVWLTGAQKKKDRNQALEKIASGQAQLVIGTHAVIQEQVEFSRLAVAIIDEQHRFGVAQRLALRNKGQTMIPHQLMMSATPIPRTLAMSYYADLDVSVIDELPPGRTPIVTRTIDMSRRAEVIERVRDAAEKGRQIYWVCPLIEESEALQLQTATETYLLLQQELAEVPIALVHGRMKPTEKQSVMADFIAGKTRLLVATTVIEVGVDVPNASLMVIEHAERFGLAQLHQLRGRVGRGDQASACLLLYQSPLGWNAKQRLLTMRNTTDGFIIAQRDLQIRGPGEFLGARQSGQAMLRFADLDEDSDLVESARTLAQELLKTDPTTVAAHLERWLGERENYLKV